MIEKLESRDKISSNEYIITNIDIIPIDTSPILSGFIHIKDGLIHELGSDSSLVSKQNNIPTYDGSSYKLFPSFINCHSHSAMSFFRGYGCFLDDSCNQESSMIENFLFPAEKSLTPEDVEIFSTSYLIDGIKSGSSCFFDHYYFIDSVAKSIENLGVKGILGETLCDINGAFLTNSESWNKIKKSIINWKYSSNIKPILAPHASDTVSEKFLKEIIDFSHSQDLGVHMHLAQTQGETQRTKTKCGLTPVELVHKCGGLTPKSIFVHMLDCSQEDLSLVEKNGSSICLCPTSEIIYEKAPSRMLIDSSSFKLLGTDCAASQDSADIFSELKTLALLSKEKGSTRFNSALKLLQTVTSSPSKIFNLNCGSISNGKSADLCYIRKDVSTINDTEENIEANLIFSSNSRFVEHLSVNGKFVLWKRKITTISEDSLKEEIQTRFNKILTKCRLKHKTTSINRD